MEGAHAEERPLNILCPLGDPTVNEKILVLDTKHNYSWIVCPGKCVNGLYWDIYPMGILGRMTSGSALTFGYLVFKIGLKKSIVNNVDNSRVMLSEV